MLVDFGLQAKKSPHVAGIIGNDFLLFAGFRFAVCRDLERGSDNLKLLFVRFGQAFERFCASAHRASDIRDDVFLAFRLAAGFRLVFLLLVNALANQLRTN